MNQENFYKVLNLFNAELGEKPLSTKLDFVLDHHLFFKMVYDENKKNCAMAKIWVTRSKDGKPRFTLWVENIYTNSYIMQDEQKSINFYEARDRFMKGSLGFFDVTLSNRLLKLAIEKTCSTISHTRYLIGHEVDCNELKKLTTKLWNLLEVFEILQDEQRIREENM